jgi:hypothetical protein
MSYVACWPNTTSATFGIRLIQRRWRRNRAVDTTPRVLCDAAPSVQMAIVVVLERTQWLAGRPRSRRAPTDRSSHPLSEELKERLNQLLEEDDVSA